MMFPFSKSIDDAGWDVRLEFCPGTVPRTDTASPASEARGGWLVARDSLYREEPVAAISSTGAFFQISSAGDGLGSCMVA